MKRSINNLLICALYFVIFVGILFINVTVAAGQQYRILLRQDEQIELKNIGVMLGKGESTSRIQDAWRSLVERSKGIDIDAAISFILKEAEIEADRNVQIAKKKVQHYEDLRRNIRDELDKTRSSLTAIEAMKKPKVIQRKVFNINPDSTGIKVYNAGNISTNAEIESYINELEEKLSTIGEDQQLAQIDLQNKLQYSQQLVQTMSNVSKMFYDTAMAIIRKIGG